MPEEPEHTHTQTQTQSQDQDQEQGQGISPPFTEVGGVPTQAPSQPEVEAPKAKPLISRLFNALGVHTSPRVDWVLDWLQVLLIAGGLAYATMSFGIVRMQVPTGSMEPTIMPGDSFFVDKFSYLLGLKKPKPGDIIVFWHQESKQCRSGFRIGPWDIRWGPWKPCRERYVKRLIAVGGQKVAIKGGRIYINDQLMTDPAFNRYYSCSGECEWEVPPGKFFVLGDNTNSSYDSRSWGFADERDFIGEPFFRVWPLSRIGLMNRYFGSPP